MGQGTSDVATGKVSHGHDACGSAIRLEVAEEFGGCAAGTERVAPPREADEFAELSPIAQSME